MKIAVVIMVKMEADILESFVRHSLTFADIMIFADHKSVDRTGEILQSLQEEGLPIEVQKLHEVELSHGETMTRLTSEAFDRYGVDYVLPLDVDEFLVTNTSRYTVRTAIEQLAKDQIYFLHWRQCEPYEPDTDREEFLLSRPCLFASDYYEGKKVLIGREIWEGDIKLVQGAHFAYRGADREKGHIDSDYAGELEILHYHWRSEEQYATKMTVGWVNNVAKYGLNTDLCNYMQKSYYELMQGKVAKFNDPLENGRRVVPIKEFPWCCMHHELRYTTGNAPDFVRSLMIAAEQIAASHAEKDVLSRRCNITVILPFDGKNNENLFDSIDSVMVQNYPFIQIVVLLFDGSPLLEMEGIEIIDTRGGGVKA